MTNMDGTCTTCGSYCGGDGPSCRNVGSEPEPQEQEHEIFHGSEPKNTLGQWLWRRFSGDTDILFWDNLSTDDQDYWEHEARAVTRAVVRGGFKQDPPPQTDGLREKFFVKKIHDPDHKHDDCRYFVLDPLHDPSARVALGWYAIHTAHQGNNKLGLALVEWLERLGITVTHTKLLIEANAQEKTDGS